MVDDYFSKVIELKKGGLAKLGFTRENLAVGFGWFAGSASRFIRIKNFQNALPDMAGDRSRTSVPPCGPPNGIVPEEVRCIAEYLNSDQGALPPPQGVLRFTQYLNHCAADGDIDPRISKVANVLLNLIAESRDPTDGVRRLRVLKSFSAPDRGNITRKMLLLLYNGEEELFTELFKIFGKLREIRSGHMSAATRGAGAVDEMAHLSKLFELLDTLLVKSRSSQLSGPDRLIVKGGLGFVIEKLRGVLERDEPLDQALQGINKTADEILAELGRGGSAQVLDIPPPPPAPPVRKNRRRSPRRVVQRGRLHAVETARRTLFGAARVCLRGAVRTRF